MSKPLTAFDQDPKIAQRLRRERCRYLRAKDVPLRKIAEEVGLSVKHVSSLTADLADRKSRIEVPGWVPAALRNVYVQIGQQRGEHEAASECRRLKADLSQGVKLDHSQSSLWSAR